MTKASSDVWEITYENIDKFDNYMVKFVCNGEWSILSWGSDGTLDSTTAVCNGENIIFAVAQNNSTVKLVLDLSGFDSETMQGAKYYIYVNGVQINGKSATVGYTITFAPNGAPCLRVRPPLPPPMQTASSPPCPLPPSPVAMPLLAGTVARPSGARIRLLLKISP